MSSRAIGSSCGLQPTKNVDRKSVADNNKSEDILFMFLLFC
jgi:hypothetical protein